MFDDGEEERAEAARLDYYEIVLYVDSKPRDYGKERGLNPQASQSQQQAVKKLTGKLVFKSSSSSPSSSDPKDGEVEEGGSEGVDLLSRPRVILHEGRVVKKSSGVLQMNSKRMLYLLNDYLLICSQQSSGGIFSKETFLVHANLDLKDTAFANLSLSISGSEDNSCCFQVIGRDKTYTFATESESDKRIWLEELEAAIFCVRINSSNDSVMAPGWRHEVRRGTFHSACMLGDVELTKAYINNLDGASVDIVDEAGMYPLHLAAMNGHLAIVELLVQQKASIDILNNGLNSPLMLAAANGHDAVVMFLLTQGADFTLRNMKDRDALFMSVLYAYDTRGLYHIITVLTSRGVNLNQVDASGATPLHECAARNLSHPVLLLVDAGANVNTRHGRNGLTPLQIACTVERPDIETIQSFLDKGAHSNWKDVSKMSAFDLVLRAHSERINKISATSTKDKGTLNEMDIFVQFALPVLTELVRKGCRYDMKSVEKLRNSFIETIANARLVWVQRLEPEGFEDFVQARGENNLIANSWVSDSASKHCLLCQDTFNYSNRRHHCRGCGILCCELCSSKTLVMKISKPSSSSAKGPLGERVCDSCFNTMDFQCAARQQEIAKAKRELEKQEARLLEEQKASASSKQSSSLFGSLRDKSLVSSPGGGGGGGASGGGGGGGVNATAAIANEVLDNLNERGKKLETSAEKSEQMLTAAQEFNSSTKELLRQQRAKANNWGV